MKAHQRKDGLFEAKGLDAGGRRKSYYGRSPEEAVSKAELSIKCWEPFDQETLYGYYATVFLPTIKHCAKGTLRTYAGAFDKTWIPLFGDRRMEDVDRADVQRAVNSMRFKPGTISQYVSKLSAVFDLAVSDGVVSSNPCSRVRKPRVVSDSPRPLSATELWELYQSTDVRNAVVLMGFFGLRIGECCGLLSRDLTDVLRVERQYPDLPLKSPCSYRTLPVPEECRIEKSGIRVVEESPFLVRKALPVSPHSLRHTFNTILEWDLGCPRGVTRALMGHAGDTTDRYSHKNMDKMREWLSSYWRHVSTASTTKKGVVRLG